ncbi:MAG: type VI secretion system protein TssA [Marinobacter sp.]|nr:type VI secretion system protein TssA [Marinobacter sp.]
MDSATFSLFDASALLAPISPEQPCGDDTRGDASPLSPYFTLKDVRNQARALERQVLANDEVIQVPQWKQLAEEIPMILCERSKDLEFVAWYIEALCREHGFLGLAEGFDLARHMLEQHWEQVHPGPDEEGMATRIAPLVGLNGMDGDGTLVQPILSVPLFNSSNYGTYAAWHAEQAAEINRLDADKAQQRIRSGAVSPDDLAQAVRETPVPDLVRLHQELKRAQAAFAALSDTMDRVMDGEPQPTTKIRKALEQCASVLAHHAGEVIEKALAAQAPVADAEDQGADAGQAADGTAPGQGAASQVDPVDVAIRSRNQAIGQLRELSEFFRKTEPHSPVSYVINQAIRWSELSLPELMQELITDSGAREGFCRVTGVPRPE